MSTDAQRETFQARRDREDAALLRRAPINAIRALPAVQKYLLDEEPAHISRLSDCERIDYGFQLKANAAGAIMPFGFTHENAMRLCTLL